MASSSSSEAPCNPTVTEQSEQPISEAGDIAPPSETTAPVGLSKNQLRKLAKEQARKEYWRNKRRQEKEKKKAKRRKLVEELKASGDPNIVIPPQRKQKRKLEEIPFSKQKLVVDMQFYHLMVDKEKRSLMNQIGQLYGANMRQEHPMLLYFTGCSPDVMTHFSQYRGSENWRGVTKESKSYLEIFPKDKLVYLTSESDDLLEELNEDDVYIIGGIVDHNRLKGLTFKQATEEGLRTARLPIDKYLEMKTRKVLTVNQVGEILMMYYAKGRNWEEALVELIPKRKGAKRKADSELSRETIESDSDNSSDADDKMEQETQETSNITPQTTTTNT